MGEEGKEWVGGDEAERNRGEQSGLKGLTED